MSPQFTVGRSDLASRRRDSGGASAAAAFAQPVPVILNHLFGNLLIYPIEGTMILKNYTLA
jgi:hypothetical protein